MSWPEKFRVDQSCSPSLEELWDLFSQLLPISYPLWLAAYVWHYIWRFAKSPQVFAPQETLYFFQCDFRLKPVGPLTIDLNFFVWACNPNAITWEQHQDHSGSSLFTRTFFLLWSACLWYHAYVQGWDTVRSLGRFLIIYFIKLTNCRCVQLTMLILCSVLQRMHEHLQVTFRITTPNDNKKDHRQMEQNQDDMPVRKNEHTQKHTVAERRCLRVWRHCCSFSLLKAERRKSSTRRRPARIPRTWRMLFSPLAWSRG